MGARTAEQVNLTVEAASFETRGRLGSHRRPRRELPCAYMGCRLQALGSRLLCTVVRASGARSRAKHTGFATARATARANSMCSKAFRYRFDRAAAIVAPRTMMARRGYGLQLGSDLVRSNSRGQPANAIGKPHPKSLPQPFSGLPLKSLTGSGAGGCPPIWVKVCCCRGRAERY
jgi:hypothetical protein